MVAPNGREALAALDRSPDAFDLILMDVQMPELGGLETTATDPREREEYRHAYSDCRDDCSCVERRPGAMP